MRKRANASASALIRVIQVMDRERERFEIAEPLTLENIERKFAEPIYLPTAEEMTDDLMLVYLDPETRGYFRGYMDGIMRKSRSDDVR